MKTISKNKLNVLAIILTAAVLVCFTATPLSASAYTENAVITTFYASDSNLSAGDFETGATITVTSNRNYSGGHNDLFGIKVIGVDGETVISFTVANVSDGENDTSVKLGIRANEDMANQFDNTYLQIISVDGAEKSTLNEKDCAYIELDKGESARITITFATAMTENTAIKFSPYAFSQGFVGKLQISEVTVGEQTSVTEPDSSSEPNSEQETTSDIATSEKLNLKPAGFFEDTLNVVSVLLGVIFLGAIVCGGVYLYCYVKKRKSGK